MLYPEQQEIQGQYILGIQRDILDQHCSKEAKRKILLGDVDFATECALDDKGEALAALEKVISTCFLRHP
jgi:hypothetical protein